MRILQLKSEALVESQGILTCQMPYLPFQPGTYKVEVALINDEAEPAKLQESFLFVSHDPKQEKQLYEESDSFVVPYVWRQD